MEDQAQPEMAPRFTITPHDLEQLRDRIVGAVQSERLEWRFSGGGIPGTGVMQGDFPDAVLVSREDLRVLLALTPEHLTPVG